MSTLLRGLCPDCSKKLNYHSKKREVKKLKKERRKSGRSRHPGSQSTSSGSTSGALPSKSAADVEETDAQVDVGTTIRSEKQVESLEKQCWTKPADVEDKSREEEFDEYLEDLLL